MSIRVSPEDVAAAALAQKKREAARAALRLKAEVVIGEALLGGPVGLEAEFARALVESAAAAMADLYDDASVQACLGRMAARYGGDLPSPKAHVRRAAERAFKARAQG